MLIAMLKPVVKIFSSEKEMTEEEAEAVREKGDTAVYDEGSVEIWDDEKSQRAR